MINETLNSSMHHAPNPRIEIAMTVGPRRSPMRKTLPFIWLYTAILTLFAFIAWLSDSFAGISLQLTFWSGMLLLFAGGLFLKFDST
ncbi:hypothetical protein ACFY5D_01965 [Paeniglutamicibacter sp. NPDC012692]|uniref:hypothetical protein n=1 Tax=Paeniglutamicibacter sp. NPDC012692 TaxID=3364388 RepID=UPI00367DA8A3